MTDPTRALERLEKCSGPYIAIHDPAKGQWHITTEHGATIGRVFLERHARLLVAAPALIACARALEEFVKRYPRYGPEVGDIGGCCGWCACKDHQEDCDVGIAEDALAALVAAVRGEGT